MGSWLRLSLIFSTITLLPVIPFLVLGPTFEAAAESWVTQTENPIWLASLTTMLLALDIFLPIPSSVLGTWLGSQIGWLKATVICWLGLTIGASMGYILSYRFGSPLAARFSKPLDLQSAQQLAQRFGAITLVLTRGLPILGEALVLVMGVYRLSWWRFFLPVATANLGLSLGYSLLGHWASAQGWLPMALALSAAIPLLAFLLFRSRFPSLSPENKPPTKT
jgi:membrane protein DedA with SNARE-associated domain